MDILIHLCYCAVILCVSYIGHLTYINSLILKLEADIKITDLPQNYIIKYLTIPKDMFGESDDPDVPVDQPNQQNQNIFASNHTHCGLHKFLIVNSKPSELIQKMTHNIHTPSDEIFQLVSIVKCG